MRKEPLIFLNHILESIRNIEEYSKGLTKEKLTRNIKVQDAIIRRIEIIGEAIKSLPTNFIKKYSEVPWKEIAGTRDKLIHGYFGVDLDIVWKIVREDISQLKKMVQGILIKESK